MRADQDEKPDDEADDSENGEEEDLVGDILSKAKDIPEEKEEEDVDEESNDGQRQSIVEKISSSIQSMGQLSAEEEERAEAQREIDRQILMSTNELNEDVWSESEKENHANFHRLTSDGTTQRPPDRSLVPALFAVCQPRATG